MTDIYTQALQSAPCAFQTAPVLELVQKADVPLIWTTKGNVPVETLTYLVSWEDTPDYVKFTETYKDGDEVVKQSSHVMSKKGVSSEAVAQSF